MRMIHLAYGVVEELGIRAARRAVTALVAADDVLSGRLANLVCEIVQRFTGEMYRFHAPLLALFYHSERWVVQARQPELPALRVWL
jgi:hypothetical protein